MRPSRRKAIAGMTAAAGAAMFGIEALPENEKPHVPEREKVIGIGGFFFRAHDPKALSRWYQDHLGINITPQTYTDTIWTQEAGPTAFTPFPEDTGYFGDPTKQWLINFRVRDLERLAQQLETAGVAVKRDPETYPNGRFARIHDPEGNAIELWQPTTPATHKERL